MVSWHFRASGMQPRGARPELTLVPGWQGGQSLRLAASFPAFGYERTSGTISFSQREFHSFLTWPR